MKIYGRSSSKIARTLAGKRKIWDYRWDEELKEKAWVAHPKCDEAKRHEKIPQTDDRRLLLLEEFLDFLNDELDPEKKIPLNIELKGQKLPIVEKNIFLEADEEGNPEMLRKFKEIIDLKGKSRTIIVASTSEKVLMEFDKINPEPSNPTNLSVIEQLQYSQLMSAKCVRTLSGLLRILKLSKRKKADLSNMAFETSYELVSRELVEKVREERGATYVFLTSFGPSRGLVEKCKTEDLADAINAILDTGVDGIMTDYPCKVGKIMEQWR